MRYIRFTYWYFDNETLLPLCLPERIITPSCEGSTGEAAACEMN